jgi:YVTN family beta-propeller protein
MQYKNQTLILSSAIIACLQACDASDNNASGFKQDSGGATAKLVDPAVGAAGANERPAPAGPDDQRDKNDNTHKKGYVGLFGDGAVGVLDLETMKIIKTVPVTAPDGLVVTPDGKQVFVSSTDQGSVVVLSTEDDSITTSIDVGAKPAGLTVTPDGKQVVASVGGANEAVIIDTETREVVDHVPVDLAHSSCVTKDGRYAYVGSQVTDAPAVVTVDLTGALEPKSLPVDRSPRALACEDGGIYYTAVGLDAVEILDPETGKVSDPIETGGSPHDIRRACDSSIELVVSQTAGDLEFIDTGSHKVVDKVVTGKLAHWIAVSADGKLAYVTNETDDNVSIVDLDARELIDTIDVGDAPRKIGIQR